MNKQYKHYTDVTREILDTIKIGDLIKINNWKNQCELWLCLKITLLWQVKYLKPTIIPCVQNYLGTVLNIII